jgi:hypothetical protein
MRLFFLSVTTALLGALLAVGCGNTVTTPGDTGPAPKAPTNRSDPPTEARKDDTPADKGAEPWGTVKGRVTWRDKDLPALPPLAVTADVMHCTSRGPIPDEKWVVNKDNKGVKYVVVWLAGAGPGKELPIHPSLKEIKDKTVLVEQPCCRFEPRVVALREGQTLIAKNNSPVLHNFNYVGGEGQGDNKAIAAGAELPIADLKASGSAFTVSCGVHPWMKGYFRVFDHPYFAVTDADGRFEIKNAPAGKYSIVLWHEDGGWVTGSKKGKPIEIKPGGVTEVNETTKPAE